MRPLPVLRILPAVVLLGMLLPARGIAGGTEVILDANFDDKPIGLPIGTGGAIVGEPVSVSSTISALVRDWPFPTPSLKINDDDLLDPGFVRFQFLDNRVVSEGTLIIAADIWFVAFEDYSIRVLDNRTTPRRFATIYFGSTGGVRFTDGDSPIPTEIASYTLDRPFPIEITFHMATGTYDLKFDGATLLADESHGNTQSIRALLFGMEADDDDDGEFGLDNLVVTWIGPTSVDRRTWAGTKAAYR